MPVTEKVSIGCVHGDTLVNSFAESLAALTAFDRGQLGLLSHDRSKLSVRVGTDGLPAARNTVAEQLLMSDVDWLLWIDSDMGFQPDLLYRLRAAADPVERPVVGALCFALRQFAHDGMHGFRTRPTPTIYQWTERPDGRRQFIAPSLYPVNELIRCEATGSAALLIHRSVFEAVSKDLQQRGQLANTWYDRIRGTDGQFIGEDISFCMRVGAAGLPIHVHTGARTTHYKTQWVSEADHWMRYVAPPASEPVAVVATGETTSLFSTTLRASTGLATVHGSIAESDEAWVVLANGDETFHPGWLDHAQHVATALNASVVGLNNPRDPACADGTAATSVLVARAYVEEFGADVKAVVAAAQERDEWTMALGAIVDRPDAEPVEPTPPNRDGRTTPRYAIIPTHNRPEKLTALVTSLGTQCDNIVIVDNASTPPVDADLLGAAVAGRASVTVIRDEEQPPNLARFWNIMFDLCADLAKQEGFDAYDVAVLNDDSIVPAGWYDACATSLRGHETAVIAHTTVTSPRFRTDLDSVPGNRMTPHAFVIRGEAGLRADERMRWWYQDTDLELQARLAGGVLSVDGPQVINSLANTTTVGPLAEQAGRDRQVFEQKWAGR